MREAATCDGDGWDLTATEKLVVICLAQRYLRNDPLPQPLTWAEVAAELAELRPAETWTRKRAARVVMRRTDKAQPHGARAHGRRNPPARRQRAQPQPDHRTPRDHHHRQIRPRPPGGRRTTLRATACAPSARALPPRRTRTTDAGVERVTVKTPEETPKNATHRSTVVGAATNRPIRGLSTPRTPRRDASPRPSQGR